MGRGGRAWLRWASVPWTEAVLAVTVLASAATPSFLVSAAGIWRAASRDDVAEQTVERAPLDRNGIDVNHEVTFDPVATPAADDAVRTAMSSIPELGTIDRTYYTLPGLLALGPPVRQVGPAGRLFARDGAIDALEITERLPDTTGGVYVSSWFAERNELELGDFIGFEAGAIADEQWNDIVQGGGAASVFRIVGFYEPLWSSDPGHRLSEYWAAVPPEVVPVFVSAFNGPNSELVVTDADTLLGSGLTGVARWRAPLTTVPSTFVGLRDLRDRFRAFDLGLVGTGSLGASIQATATPAGGRPRLTTELFDTTETVERAVRQLDAPLESARAIGAVVGLVAMVAVGVFFVERRRTEFRLLAAEGHSVAGIAVRVAGQLAPPVALGSMLGVVAATFGLRWFGPARRADFTAVPWRAVGAVSVAGLLIAAVVAGYVAIRTLRRSSVSLRVASNAVLALLLAAAAFTWVQSGRTTTSGGADVDLAVVALPVVVVLLVVVAGVAIVGACIGRLARRSERLPIVAFLAARRLAVGGGGLRIVAGAMGLGVGLLVFAVALTSTLDRTVDVKLATQVGGESALSLTGEPPPAVDLPPGTTLMRTLDTVVTPDRRRTRVIAIDPATWADAVTWPSSFGTDPQSVLRALERDLGPVVPAIAVRGEGTPAAGSFGLARTFPFEIVGRVDSMPGAGVNASTILVSAPALERVALDLEGYETVQEAVSERYVLPTARFSRRLVSQSSADDLVAAVEAAGLGYRDVDSRDARRRDAGVLAAKAAFGYLAVLGVAAAAAAAVALGLSLASRRRARSLGAVMTRSMGLASGRSAAVTAVEVTVILVVAVAASFVSVPPVVRRLASRFDPAPDVPPGVDVVVAWPTLVAIAVVAVVVAASAVWLLEWRDMRRSPAEVLRGG